MPIAEPSLGTDTAIHVPTAFTRSARAVGVTVTHSTLAAAKAWDRATYNRYHRLPRADMFMCILFPLRYARHMLQLLYQNLCYPPLVPQRSQSLNNLGRTTLTPPFSPKSPGTSTEDALMSLTAGIITLAQVPRALSTATAASTLALSFPTAQGPCPIRGSAPRFQIQGGELSLRAFTESTQAAGGTTGRERQRREMWGRKFDHPLTCLSRYPLNPRSPKR